jgi:hypothetical protein
MLLWEFNIFIKSAEKADLPPCLAALPLLGLDSLFQL